MTADEEKRIRESMRIGVPGEYKPCEQFTYLVRKPEPKPQVVIEDGEIYGWFADEI